MAKIMILGATGSLGTHVTEQALAANHEVSVLVRTPAKLPADLRDRVTVHQADIATLPASELAALVRNQEALINAAGHVSDGQQFVALVDHLVTSVETLPASARPRCWFLAGAALLDIGDTGRRGVDLPPIRTTYWPHAENFARLQSSSLDWRLLCPGPMVEEPPVGLARLRVSMRSAAGRDPGCGHAVAGPPPRLALHGARAGDDRAVRRCRDANAEPSGAWERHGVPPHRSRVADRDARREGELVSTSRNGGQWSNTLVAGGYPQSNDHGEGAP